MPRRIAPHLPSVRAFVPSQLEGDRLVTVLSRSKMWHSIFWLNAGPWAKELTLVFKFRLVRVVALKVTASLSADLQSLVERDTAWAGRARKKKQSSHFQHEHGMNSFFIPFASLPGSQFAKG